MGDGILEQSGIESIGQTEPTPPGPAADMLLLLKHLLREEVIFILRQCGGAYGSLEETARFVLAVERDIDVAGYAKLSPDARAQAITKAIRKALPRAD
jgi:hypothetical protein